jgi:hypothetical protein
VAAGGSHAGKTTLATALATSGTGWSFVADEVSELDPDTLTVAPYGKPVALRPASVALLGADRLGLHGPGSRFEHDARLVPPSSLAQQPAATPSLAQHPAATLDVSLVVFPRFDASWAGQGSTGQPSAIVTPVGPAEALTRLTGLTLVGGTLDRHVFRTLERLVRSAPAYEVVHRDARDAARAVRSLVT